MWKKNKIKKALKSEKVKVFKQFKKQQIFSQISFVFAALVLGFWINSFVLNWQYWNQLKTSLLESNQVIEKKADIYIEKDWDSSRLQIKAGKDIKQVKSLSLSLIYNAEQINIKDIFSKIKWTKLVKIENEKWVATLIINFDDIKNVKSW